ncbi:DUF1580 domain-containing protein [Botrimarina hoheduenensis]|uniref:Helix-turn-helix domain protein n=1 Tax=Botrimarina hoheduenensis TaxID=2528000 RepID=A0A5C5W991_9BACT|nr:DUF1580 domain-containing protein [Botrimarina hoheduenensis]TWT47184.1 hypothetical protein Pla111_07960 [Botrimarina hoheduenensis]
MTSLMDEKRLTLTELAKRERVNVCTVWRWAQRGAKGVRLETFSVGGRRYTTQEAFRRFVSGTTRAAQGTEAGHSSCVAEDHEFAAADAFLDAEGV